MPTNTYVALDRVTVTSSVTSITLNMGSSISQAYTDLVLVANTIVPSGNTYPECSLRFNGDTGSNYSNTYLLGLGSGTGVSGRGTNYTYADCGYLTTNSGNPNTRIINIMNYSNSTTFKTVISRGSSDNAGQVIAYTNLWRNTAPITSITVFTQGSTYAAGSTFSLYGIAAAGVSPAAKATGGTIYSDDTYYYHVFGSTGTFTPLSSLTADVLVVAGGGGGGVRQGGGGGAGGVVYFASQSLTATGYTCTVGGGGAGRVTDTGNGNNGTNSQFASLTAAIGGGGGMSNGVSQATGGNSGGSGGGGNNGYPSGTPLGGSSTQTGTGATAFYGNAGGNGNGTVYASGGGGGAGGVGANGSSAAQSGANGGIGTSVFSSWGLATGTGENVSGTVYYAGGAGAGAGGTGTGGTGGAGGGGAGGIYDNAGASVAYGGVSGTANTGGGGGATGGNNGNYVRASGSGGSGIVIIRYAK